MKKFSVIRFLIDKLGVNGDDIKLRRNMLSFFLTVFLVPIALIVALFFHYSSSMMQNEMAQVTLRSLSQLKNNLEYRFNNVAENSIILMSSLYPYLNRSEKSDTLSQQIDDFSSISRLISNYSGRYMVNSIRLYVDDRKMYANQRFTMYPLSELDNIELYKECLNNGHRVMWVETYKIQGTKYRPVEQNISCAVTLASVQDFTEISGVLLFNIPEDKLSNILDIGLNSNESVYLVNHSGVVLSHSDKSRIGTVGLNGPEMEEISSRGSGVIKNKGEILAFESIDYPDWYLIARIPERNLFQIGGWSFYSVGLLSVIGIVLLLALALILLFSTVIQSMVQRISHAVRTLEIQGLGALSQEMQLMEGKATITSLESNVDYLIATIKKLLDESYQAKISSRESLLKALQAQINPHFLYNTLDAIKWMVMDQDTKQSVWMINSLSRYFRLSLNKGRDIVQIQDEYDLINTYLGIQQKRFSNPFTVTSDIDERVLKYQIPKLTLQPIVENALLHGLRELTGRAGNINIFMAIDEIDEDITIEISDNGCGMNEEALRNILQPHSGGYGLNNVNERIRLFCGEDYGLTAVSEPGRGTVVTLRLRAVVDR